MKQQLGYVTVVSFLSQSFSFVYSVYIYLVPTIARLGMASDVGDITGNKKVLSLMGL